MDQLGGLSTMYSRQLVHWEVSYTPHWWSQVCVKHLPETRTMMPRRCLIVLVRIIVRRGVLVESLKFLRPGPLPVDQTRPSIQLFTSLLLLLVHITFMMSDPRTNTNNSFLAPDLFSVQDQTIPPPPLTTRLESDWRKRHVMVVNRSRTIPSIENVQEWSEHIQSVDKEPLDIAT